MVMLPGAAVTHENFGNIINDIALLTNLGVRVVLVHGARQQIESKLKAQDIECDFHKGRRITSAETLPLLVEAIASTRIAIEAALSAGLANSPMHGADIRVRSGNVITAMPCGIVDGINYQHTGKVRKIDTHAIDEVIFSGALALISPLGYSLTGEVFNLTYTEVAAKVAIEIGADKLIAFTKNNGVLDDNSELQKQLTLLQCEKLLLRKDTSDSHFSLQACHQACDQGVNRAQLISYVEDGALIKELFTRDGFGTMVHRDSYETIRRARIDDVGGILELIRPLEEDGVLVKRSREKLEQEIEHFTVMEIDSTIIACAALYPFVQDNAGELACVVTHPDYQGGGKAGKLLSHIEKQASKIKMTQLFVLTTQTAHWFLEQGFKESTLEILPQERKKIYNYQRNSKIFVKAL